MLGSFKGVGVTIFLAHIYIFRNPRTTPSGKNVTTGNRNKRRKYVISGHYVWLCTHFAQTKLLLVDTIFMFSDVVECAKS